MTDPRVLAVHAIVAIGMFLSWGIIALAVFR